MKNTFNNQPDAVSFYNDCEVLGLHPHFTLEPDGQIVVRIPR